MMDREAAIEAGARALIPEAWATPSGVFPVMGETWETAQERAKGDARRRAAAVIDAALPHLVGEPVGWALVMRDDTGDEWTSGPGDIYASPNDAKVRLLRTGEFTGPVVALVPVEPIGNDGLTDAEREEYARRYREGPGSTDLGSRLP